MYALTSLSTSRPCIVFVGHVGVAFCGSPGIQLCDAGENAAIVVDVESPGPFFFGGTGTKTMPSEESVLASPSIVEPG